MMQITTSFHALMNAVGLKSKVNAWINYLLLISVSPVALTAIDIEIILTKKA